jgi:hypothetical protein
MNWWEVTILALVTVVSIATGGLMGAWAAERRLDQLQRKELYQSPVPPLNPQKAEDVVAGSTLKGGLTDG